MTRLRGALISLFLVVPCGVVADGNNTAFVAQNGIGNTLLIDQSAASDSHVRGLGGWSSQALLGPVSGTNPEKEDAFDLFFASAGSGNEPLLQSGDDNEAHVIISGQDAIAVMMQLGDGNDGRINLAVSNTRGMLLQAGDENRGLVRVSATGAAGIMEQNGSNNDTELNVTSPGTRAILRVNGSGLSGDSPYTVNGTASFVEISISMP